MIFNTQPWFKKQPKKVNPKSAKFSSDSAFVSSMGQLIDSDERDA